MHVKFRFIFAVVLTIGFTLALSGADVGAFSVSVEAVNSERIGLYEKFEITVGLDATYTNPYYPDEVDLRAVFTSPSGKKWEICGFYDGASWKVRFSPDETGEWKYVVKVTNSEGTAQSGVITDPIGMAQFSHFTGGQHGCIAESPGCEQVQY